MRKRIGIPVLVLLLLVVGSAFVVPDEVHVVRIGIVTDVHAHDTNSPNEHKVMVNFLPRLEAFVAAMTAWPADAVIELGDLVNGAFVMGAALGDPARIPSILGSAVQALRAFSGPTYFVVGNHDVYDLSKAEFLAGTGSSATFHSFDLGAYHVVVLDAQYDKSGQDYGHIGWMVQGAVPAPELDWLRADLAQTAKPTVVCIHQPLDSAFEMLAGGPSISNASDVRAVLSASNRVIAVFQGHDHENRHAVIDGVSYVTFAAMVDGDEPTEPSWAEVTLDPDARTIHIDGRGLQESLEIPY